MNNFADRRSDLSSLTMSLAHFFVMPIFHRSNALNYIKVSERIISVGGAVAAEKDFFLGDTI